MGKQVILQPCFGEHDIVVWHHSSEYTSQRAQRALDYFGPPREPFFLGDGKTVYEFCGQHVFRDNRDLACLKDIFTGDKFDLSIYEYGQAVGLRGSWKVLNEMEVLAWASK